MLRLAQEVFVAAKVLLFSPSELSAAFAASAALLAISTLTRALNENGYCSGGPDLICHGL